MKRYLLAGSWMMPLLLPVAAEACAVCWGLNDRSILGFQASYYLLVGAPFVIFGSIAGWLLWAHRSTPGRRREKAPGPGWTSLEGQD